MGNLNHSKVEIKVKIKSSPKAVFSAFADIEKRVKWAVPDGDAIKYLKSSFEVGGVDHFICGDPDSMEFNGINQYEEIIENEMIVSLETIHHKDKKLSSALVSIELAEIGGGTELNLVAQITSYVGDMSQGYKLGWEATLKHLSKFLAE